ncbi:MAG: hypothetical protein WAO58_09140 [Fimbriimonadaceae bacterium]
MRRYIVPLLAVLVPLIAILSIAQSPPASPLTVKAAMDALREDYPRIKFYMSGQRVSRVYGIPFGEGETAADTAKSLVSQFGAAFNPGDGTYEFDRTQDVMNGKFTAVYFNQKLGGLPVDKADLTVLVKNQPGYPAVLISSNVRDVEGISTSPRVTKAEARNLVRNQDRTLKSIGEPELIVYRGESDTYLAWKLIADNLIKERPKKFRVFVDANSGAILEWRNMILTVDVNGNVQGKASAGLKPDNNLNPPTQMAIAGLRVAITGGNIAYSDSLGDFVIANGGSSQVTVTADMTGRWVRVIPVRGTPLALSQNVTPPGPANFVFNPSPTEFNTAQLNALRHTEMVHDFAKAINNSYPGIDIQMPANVNLNDTCNAYYDFSSINFFGSQSQSGCPNTAYSTVVDHEYGHHIVDSGHPNASGDYHEGMADTTAVMLTNQPGTGEDFFGPNTGPLRSAINNFTYPCGGEAHDCGNVISGAFWLTKEALKDTIGDGQALILARSWYLNSILLRPSGITPEITIDVLTLDDNDGDIGNGTPHYTEIAQGFGAKNLDAPPLNWLAITPLQIPGEFTVLQNSTSLVMFKFRVDNVNGQLDPATFKLNYRYDQGSWQQASVISTGGGIFPRPLIGRLGSTLQYYVSVKDTQGHTVQYPSEGQANPLRATFGRGLSTTFADTFESNLAWTVVNESLSTGAWTRANPNGTTYNGRQYNPENDSGDTGGQCMFTGQGSQGGDVGENDVDGGPTRLVSPTFDMSSGNHFISLRRWFANTTGEDSMRLEISNNNGASWVTIETVIDTGSTNQWTLVKFPVTAYITPTAQMKIRISTSDNPNDSIAEGGVDDVIVEKILK